MKFSKKPKKQFRDRISDPKARFFAFLLFFVIVFFTGGGARDDIQSLLLLRPLAVLFCAYSLTVLAPDQWRGRMFPLYIGGALFVLMLLQQISLPPSIWTGLPGRQIFADIADMAEIDQPWRPISLSPSKTLNSFFALLIPIAAMMLYLNLHHNDRNKAVGVIVALCTVSAVWSMFQLAGPARSPLYLYQITNFGNGVGLFANRNHHAVMLAITIVMLGWVAGCQRYGAKFSTLKFYGCFATLLVFIPLVFVTGSRAGLLLMAPALILALFFIYVGRYDLERVYQKAMPRGRKTPVFSIRQIFLALSAILVVSMAALSIILSRSLAYDRLFGGSSFSEQRFEVLPTLVAMVREYFPWGSGFGSFEHVYKIYEPLKLLSPKYLNQAHNDWFQFIIEGGLAAVLIAAAAVSWTLVQMVVFFRHWRFSRYSKYRVIMSMSVMLFLLVASVSDYPLRVPSIMAIFSVMACLFNDSVRTVQLNATKNQQ